MPEVNYQDISSTMNPEEQVCPESIPHETFNLSRESPNRALLIGQSGAGMEKKEEKNIICSYNHAINEINISTGKSYFLKELCQNYRSLVFPRLNVQDPGFVFVYSYQTVKPDLRIHNKDTIFYISGLPTVNNILQVCHKYENKTSGVILILDDVLSAMESLNAEESNEYQKLIVEWSRIKVFLL